MMTLCEQEAATYAELWGGVDAYARTSPGEGLVPMFLEMANPIAGQTVLDAGCGQGRGAMALAEHGLLPALTDLLDVRLPTTRDRWAFAVGSLWQDLAPVAYLAKVWDARFDGERFDWVYCCDVLEHLPPEFTMLAIWQLLHVTKHGLCCAISTRPDGFSAFVGRPLHLTVRPFTWWRDRLRELGTMIEARDLLDRGIFLVKPCAS